MSKRILVALMLTAAACTGAPAEPAADTAAAAAALRAYEFGSDRSAIAAIEAAVHAAGTDAAARAAIAEALVGVAVGDATLDGRRAALRLIGLCASDADAAKLTPLLADKATADAAILALEQIPGTAVDSVLAGALAGLTPEMQPGVIESLGRRRAAGAVQPLIALLGAEQTAVANAAAKALGMIATPEACQWLVQAREAANDANRAAITDGCLRCAGNLAAADAGAAMAIAGSMAGGGNPPHVRVAAITAMMQADPDGALDRVVSAFRSGMPELVEFALGHIRTVPGAEATLRFAAMFQGLDTAQRALLIGALADRGDPAAAPAVLELAGNTEEPIVLAAVTALGKIGNEAALPVLLDKAVDAPRAVKAAARESLATLPGKETDAQLAEAAAAGAPERRVQALKALADRNPAATLPKIRPRCEDDDAEVRGAALQVLRNAGGPDDLKYLVERMAKAASADRDGIAQGIVAIAQREGAPGKRSGAVLKAYTAAKDAETRALWLGVLGRVGSDDALDAIGKATGDADAGVRLAAVKALAGWPSDAALPRLEALSAPGGDAELRSAAFAGYARLLRESKSLAGAERFAKLAAAMANAQDAAERRAVIGSLAAAPSKGALDLAVQYRSDPELAAEATQAALQIALAVCGAYPDEAKALAVEIMGAAQDDATRHQADAVRKAVNAFMGYITAWQYAGPYSVEGKTAGALFKTAFAPESKPDEVAWSLMPMAINPEMPYVASLSAVLGGFERVAYLRTAIEAPAAQDALLKIGSNDGCKAWLNGALVHEIDTGRTLTPDQDAVPVKLEAGRNLLLIAVYQQGGDWSACARITAPDGSALEGVNAVVPE